MIRLLLFCFAAYLVLLLLLFFKQRSLIFQPDNTPINIVADDWLIAPVAWPSNRERQGYLIEPENATSTVIVFHGNAGQALHRAYYANALTALGYRVLLVEYPGYGGREGKPSETTLVAAGRQLIVDFVKDFPEGSIHLLGESMGSGVASAVVSGNWQPTPVNKIDSVILVTPFDSLAAVAQTHYWYTPAKWLVRDKFNNVENLKDYQGIKQVVLAGQDIIVPTRHGERLYSQLSAPKHRYFLEHVGHNNWIGQVDTNWWSELMARTDNKE